MEKVRDGWKQLIRPATIDESSPPGKEGSCTSGPRMKCWESQTRSIAARISSRIGAYCAFRSSRGTFMEDRRIKVEDYVPRPRWKASSRKEVVLDQRSDILMTFGSSA